MHAGRQIDCVLAAALFLGPAGSVQEYAGLWGLALSLPIAAAVPFVARYLADRLAPWPPRQAVVCCLATLVAVIALVAVVYPRANYQTGNRGSDRDDSADLAVTAVVNGRSPYLETTYLGNHPDITPVEIWLAAPARLVTGKSAWENVLALVVVAAIALRLPRTKHVVLVALLLAVTSLGVVRELVTGGGLVAGTVFVSAVLVWLARLPRDRPPPPAFAVALGMALSTRPSWVALGPLVLAYLWRTYGSSAALRTIGIGVVAAVVAIAPVFLVDPGGFVPWDSAAGFTEKIYNESPLTFTLATATATVLALAAAARVRSDDTSLFTWLLVVECAVLLIPVITQSVGRNRVDFQMFELGYGVQAAILGVAAWWATRAPTPRDAPSRST